MFPLTLSVEMVDLVASNLKLEQRSRNILRRLSAKCNVSSDEELDAILARCNRSVKLAILVAETGESVQTCEGYFEAAGGVLAQALASVSKPIEQKPATTNLTRKFVLCIDGGGTKCAAAVAEGTNIVGQGSAGPCNLYDSLFALAATCFYLILTFVSAPIALETSTEWFPRYFKQQSLL